MLNLTQKKDGISCSNPSFALLLELLPLIIRLKANLEDKHQVAELDDAEFLVAQLRRLAEGAEARGDLIEAETYRAQ